MQWLVPRRADSKHDRVIETPQLRYRDSTATHRCPAEQRHAWVIEQAGEPLHHWTGRCAVVGGHAKADEAERRGQSLKEVDTHRVLIPMQKSIDSVAASRASADDNDS